MDADHIERAAHLLDNADALLVGAGAGIGVDSGLPDFRGDEGFWKNYPPFKKRGLNFYDLANPRWFHDDPELAWGFYGHRLHLYRDTAPHEGFEILLEAGRRARQQAGNAPFVFTSNVDGHFQKAGFADDHVMECHGSLMHLQCAGPCSSGDGAIWPADDVSVEVDPERFRAVGKLPRCPTCGGIARPNVLMFGDARWLEARTARQRDRYRNWLEQCARPADRLVVVEVGAGTAVPTVRHQCERVAETYGGTLIRINPRESQTPRGLDAISVAAGGLEALREMTSPSTDGPST